MTKKAKIETKIVAKTQQATRKLLKKEREELEQQFNDSMVAVVESIESGRIEAPWWRRPD